MEKKGTKQNDTNDGKGGSNLNDNEKPDIMIAMKETALDKLPAEITVTENSSNAKVNIVVIELKNIASGSFGTVYEGRLNNGSHIAVKRVLQDKRYKNRELQILRDLKHNNITTLLYYFYTLPADSDEVYLNLIMDYVPQTISRICKFYFRSKSFLPSIYVKLYMYQLLRAINYLHQKGVCHRDIKPQNILIDPSKSLLRICDFGSAKKLAKNEANVAYICSRYYRAPELIFGATNYTNSIDLWSIGCVYAEILLNKPLFPGESSVDQMVEVIKIMGTPSTEEIHQMNPSYQEFKFPQIPPMDLSKIFTNSTANNVALDLLSKILVYIPQNRLHPAAAMAHEFFDELRTKDVPTESNRSIPKLFNFSDIELNNVSDDIKTKLTPKKPKKSVT